MKNKNSKTSNGRVSGILLFGPPGSGKRTLGRFLSNAGIQYHLSSHEFLQALGKEGAAKDDQIIEFLKAHVEELILKDVFSPEHQDLLLDGIPNTPSQAALLSEYIDVRHIIVLDVSNETELYKRVSEGNPSTINEGSFKSQLVDYSSKINEILSLYPKHIISHVNAEQKPLEVLRDVLVRISHLLSHGPNNH